MTKTIILDTDGTLLDWRTTYVAWLRNFELIKEDDTSEYFFKKFIKIPGDDNYQLPNGIFADALSEIFNQTYLLSKLPPINGAIKAIKTLSNEGYLLKVVSSYTTQYEAMKSREYNLKTVFGNVFQEITSLPLHSSKINYLSKQDKDSYFIEDSVGHLLDAVEVGFDYERCFLIPADWNIEHNEQLDRPFKRYNWDQIVNDILGS